MIKLSVYPFWESKFSDNTFTLTHFTEPSHDYYGFHSFHGLPVPDHSDADDIFIYAKHQNMDLTTKYVRTIRKVVEYQTPLVVPYDYKWDLPRSNIEESVFFGEDIAPLLREFRFHEAALHLKLGPETAPLGPVLGPEVAPQVDVTTSIATQIPDITDEGLIYVRCPDAQEGYGSGDYYVSDTIFSKLIAAEDIFRDFPTTIRAFRTLFIRASRTRAESQSRTPLRVLGTGTIVSSDATELVHPVPERDTQDTIVWNTFLVWLLSLHRPDEADAVVNNREHQCSYPGPCLLNRIVTDFDDIVAKGPLVYFKSLALEYIKTHHPIEKQPFSYMSFVGMIDDIDIVKELLSPTALPSYATARAAPE
jgi:hypothetical protein